MYTMEDAILEQGMQQGIQQGIIISVLISVLEEMKTPKEFIIKTLAEKFNISLEQSEKYYNIYQNR